MPWPSAWQEAGPPHPCARVCSCRRAWRPQGHSRGRCRSAAPARCACRTPCGCHWATVAWTRADPACAAAAPWLCREQCAAGPGVGSRVVAPGRALLEWLVPMGGGVWCPQQWPVGGAVPRPIHTCSGSCAWGQGHIAFLSAVVTFLRLASEGGTSSSSVWRRSRWPSCRMSAPCGRSAPWTTTSAWPSQVSHGQRRLGLREAGAAGAAGAGPREARVHPG